MPELVDIIFLDIDGVLLPFGGKARENDDDKTKNNDSDDNDDGDCFVDGCLFPNRTMHAITTLLSRLTSSYVTHVTNDNIIQQYAYNPKIVLSSTWRTQSDFIQDIISSFRAYATSCDGNTQELWNTILLTNGYFFDITDPKYFATRHDEIYKWVQSNTNNRRSRAQYKNIIFRSWIALDDEDIIHVQTGLFEGEGVRIVEDARKHAVRTVSSIGLTLADVEWGIGLLEKQILEYHSHTTTKEK
jgi:hypothetical protein